MALPGTSSRRRHSRSRARDVYESLGYERWENFAILLQRAQNLIASGEASAKILKRAKDVTIGSGARRTIVDYELDDDAVALLKRLSAGYKLNAFSPVRNETALLRLVAKYYRAKGVNFQFQVRRSGAVYDGMVDRTVVIEFDEPHHKKRRQSVRDAEKDLVASSLGLSLVRFTLKHDAVDIIIAVDSVLQKQGKQLSLPMSFARSEEVKRRPPCEARPSSDAPFCNLVLNRLADNDSLCRICSKGDQALFGGFTTHDMKARLGVPSARPLADFLPTITIKAMDFANEITTFNLKKDELRTEPAITGEHEKNNQDVRNVLLGRGIRPESLPPEEDVKKLECRLKADERKPPKRRGGATTRRRGET